MNKLLRVLWAIEKDLHAIASNKEVPMNEDTSTTVKITPTAMKVNGKRIHY